MAIVYYIESQFSSSIFAKDQSSHCKWVQYSEFEIFISPAFMNNLGDIY